jgi:hypothetical protein
MVRDAFRSMYTSEYVCFQIESKLIQTRKLSGPFGLGSIEILCQYQSCFYLSVMLWLFSIRVVFKPQHSIIIHIFKGNSNVVLKRHHNVLRKKVTVCL